MESKLRRWRSALVISGTAVIAFGFWAVLKTVLYMIMDQNYVSSLSAGSSSTAASIASMLVMLAVELAMRLYVGLSARSEGAGRRRNPGYRALAGFMATVSCLLIVAMVALIASGLAAQYDMVGSVLVALVVEITSFSALFDVLRSSASIRRAEGRRA